MSAMSIRHRFVLACTLAAAALAAAPEARAVIVDGPNGTGVANTQPPFPVAGLNNVGTVNFNPQSSGVYLGNGWALTASHVGSLPPPSFTIPSGPGAGTYFSDQAVPILNSDNSPADLAVFHLTTTPNLPALNLSIASPAVGTLLYAMGNGQTRSANLQYYSVTGTGSATVWTPLPGPTGANASGYTESGPNVVRWGDNLTTAPPGSSTPTTVINAGFGNTTVFASMFDQAGTPNELQLSAGDSGGGAFSSGNVLLGINDTEFTFENQPDNTAIFGTSSGYVDIATYRSQIASVTGVPEPASAALVLLAAPLLLRRRRAHLA